VQDILVLAKPKIVIQGLQSSKQIPRDPPDSRWKGLHGYVNSTDMRTILFAKGPGKLIKKSFIQRDMRDNE